jgi:uncharacterized protein (DUF2225 family)
MQQNIYDKTIVCPVCGTETKIKFPKKSSYKMLRKDSDLMQHYEGINPLFYGIEFCNECGYASLPSYFKTIKENQKRLIISQISAKWKMNIYPDQYDVEIAIKQHKLALLNAMVKEALSSEKALICLRLSWLYRIKEDSENERRFQEQAINSFEQAYMVENFPIGGLDKWSLLYLIGELFRRVGDNNKATAYFSQVLSTVEASSKIKEMVRDARELMK